MAKKKGGSRRTKYLRGNVDESALLTSLAGEDVTETVFDDSVIERTFISSMVAAWSLSNFTPVTDCGPIMVGVAHNDYSAADIENWIENSGAWDEGDLVSQELAKRKIRMVGIFPIPASAAETVVLNDGQPIRTKLGFILNAGLTLNLWCYNLGTATVQTTVPKVRCQGWANLWPK